MAFAVAQRAGYGRSGSRSPRLQKQVEVEEDHGGPDGLPCDFKGGFNAQMRMQRDFLAQFLVPEQPHAAKSPNAPREAAAGLPVLMLGPGPGGGPAPWLGLPAGVACVAATMRLFSRLLPGSVAEGMCDELCKQAAADPSMPVELDALATRVGLVSCESQGSRGLRRRGTSDASSEREAESDHQDPETDWSPRQSWASEDRTPRSDSPETPRPEVPTRDVAPAKTVNPVTVYVRSLNGKLLLELQQTRTGLRDMVKNRMTACCVLLESYVGVIEDDHTGEELEEEVGSHCVLVVGGPNYVTFDPWGMRGGEVSLWQSHSMAAASPLAWVQLSLPAPSL
eukprot:s2704_g4.t2